LGRSFADVQPIMAYMDNLVRATLTPAHNIPASSLGKPFRTPMVLDFEAFFPW
jgi:hypothetical protein